MGFGERKLYADLAPTKDRKTVSKSRRQIALVLKLTKSCISRTYPLLSFFRDFSVLNPLERLATLFSMQVYIHILHFLLYHIVVIFVNLFFLEFYVVFACLYSVVIWIMCNPISGKYSMCFFALFTSNLWMQYWKENGWAPMMVGATQIRMDKAE